MKKILFTALLLMGFTAAAHSDNGPHTGAPHSHEINGDITPQHGGGLNAQGCHWDRKKGTYHCHR